MSTPDYIGMILEDPDDVEHYGVPGMKWGQRRSDAQLKAAAASRGDSQSSSGGSEAAQRYERIKAQAKAGKAKDLSEEDLKWFNARTEALGKINKLTQKNPNWLKQTTNEVFKGVAKKSYQAIADAAVEKYVTGPLTDSIKKAGTKNLTFQERVQKAAKESVDKTTFENAVKSAVKKALPKEVEPSFEAKVQKAAREAAAKRMYEEAVKAETEKIMKKDEE